jgi:Mg2+/citrate symporter
MKKDTSRKWMWWFLVVLGATQVYFVRELLAAYVLFALGFAAAAVVALGAYLVQKAWEAGLQRAERHAGSALNVARRSLALVEEVSRKPFRGPGSETVQ